MYFKGMSCVQISFDDVRNNGNTQPGTAKEDHLVPGLNLESVFLEYYVVDFFVWFRFFYLWFFGHKSYSILNPCKQRPRIIIRMRISIINKQLLK